MNGTTTSTHGIAPQGSSTPSRPTRRTLRTTSLALALVTIILGSLTFAGSTASASSWPSYNVRDWDEMTKSTGWQQSTTYGYTRADIGGWIGWKVPYTFPASSEVGHFYTLDVWAYGQVSGCLKVRVSKLGVTGSINLGPVTVAPTGGMEVQGGYMFSCGAANQWRHINLEGVEISGRTLGAVQVEACWVRGKSYPNQTCTTKTAWAGFD